MGQIARNCAQAWFVLTLHFGAAADDLVPLQVELPPEVQKMFDEMCELEGVTQSEMLTRWIDARWEAMGYQDSDLAEDVLGKCKDSDCSSGEPRSTKEPSTDSIAEGEEGVSSPSTGRSAFSRDEPLERQSPPRSPSPLASAMDDDDDDEEDGVPDIETWMRRYASRGSAEEDE
ncbi:hypothetical protein AK812_SmicGene26443 [Symbiodinium microadriaticum]|uniref:Ribbon-helix-helix protein CopG domain-containing protein n=1 Tax=Symbiodinium microadriaticum TaxID=2951 RepID=A0A1Q9D9I9_SYMMI|nr:hypothetical protein AK812_SmicGene26443 [Symbiodinium microadriaticum]